MVDGAAYLMAGIYGMFAQGAWNDERGVNVLDTGAPWYDAYETKDGKWLAVGAIETRFYEEFIERLGLVGRGSAQAARPQALAGAEGALRRGHATRTRDEWENVFAGSDACVAPVLALGEVDQHPHNVARATFVRARRRAAAGAGAALFPHARRDRRAAAPARRRQRGGAGRLGLFSRRGCRAEEVRRHRSGLGTP